MTFRWGILATGNIAASMAEALNGITDAELLAVASRSHESANRFGKQWNVPRRYGSYEALAADPDVEIVYIATPHNLHFDNMRMCLNAGKHVLCEKPLTLNAHEAAVCVNLAREKGLFLMEAVWMRFFPAMHRVRQWVAAGRDWRYSAGAG
jgi:predicted dehydrogenase